MMITYTLFLAIVIMSYVSYRPEMFSLEYSFLLFPFFNYFSLNYECLEAFIFSHPNDTIILLLNSYKHFNK